MHSPEEILKAYKKELSAYAKWLADMKKVYGENSSPMESWGGTDYRKVVSWNEKIEGMEQVLGLTKAEIKKYCKETGM